MWSGLDSTLQFVAVNHLCEAISRELRGEWRKLYEEHGENWDSYVGPEIAMPGPDGEVHKFRYPFHFSEGMGVRNCLREVISDGQLPSGNWDDYYMAALERALVWKD